MKYYLFLVWFFIVSIKIFASDRPYWVEKLMIKNPQNYYVGIGGPASSRSDADDMARVEFAKSVKVNIKSSTQTLIEESNRSFFKHNVNEAKSKTEAKTDVILSGIHITDRWHDKENDKHYSLIKYSFEDYNNHVRKQIQIQIQKNRMLEKEKSEKLRHKKEISKIEQENEKQEIKEKMYKDSVAAAKEANKIKKQKEKMQLKKIKDAQKQKKQKYILNNFSDYIKKQTNDHLIDIFNAEISDKTHQIFATPSIFPFGICDLGYTFSYKLIAINAAIFFHENQLDYQEILFKLKVLDRAGKISKASLAFGAMEYLYNISKGKTKFGYTVTAHANMKLPQYYTTVSIYGERRKASLGFSVHPFFRQLSGKAEFLLQLDYMFTDDYSFTNQYKYDFVVQPGFRFETLNNKLYFTVAYEEYEFVTFKINYKM